jgi:hypothetical protein
MVQENKEMNHVGGKKVEAFFTGGSGILPRTLSTSRFSKLKIL